MKINIYQNYYLKEQEDRLDPSFIPYDNSRTTNPEYYEFGPILGLYETKKYLQSDYCGLFSYKFNTKTGISREKFKKFIIENPGYDVYFINPHPQLAYFYYNCWEQGEYWHRGLKQLSEKILNELNVISNINNIPRHDTTNLCYSNFWVANAKFWSIYGNIILKLKELISFNQKYNKELFGKTFHIDSYNTYMFPFVFERLFSSFISLNKEIKCLAYPFSKDEIFDLCFFEEEKRYLNSLFDKKFDFKDFNIISKKHYYMSKNYFDVVEIPKTLL